MQLDRLVAETQRANHASVRLLERLGMQLLGEITRFESIQSVYCLERSNSASDVAKQSLIV